MSDVSIAADLLKENGWLIVSVPNIDSAAFFLFQKYWSGLDLPRHFYDFTPTILRKYCEKAKLRVQGEYYDEQVSDFVHSTRHFLQSAEIIGRTAVCQGSASNKENAIAHPYSSLSRLFLCRSQNPGGFFQPS
jgi:hypothetical protein